MTIPVICDRCRAVGTAGTGDFAQLGDLLDFTPVPVKPRVNGWDADAQRAFIALLATTGSKRRAALAIGRNAYGIDQLLKRTDSAGFKTAYDRAMAIARQHGAMKLAQGVADAAARNAQLTPPSRLADLAPPDDEPEMDEDTKFALLESIFGKYVRKVEQEREARLAGRIVEADFTLRQLTCIEIGLDLASRRLGTSPWDVIREARMGEHNIYSIAETDLSRFLGEARRSVWAETGEPDRPEHPPRRYLEQHDGYCTEPNEYLRGGPAEEREAQIAAREKQHREDAEAQIAYETAAREQWAARARPSEVNASPLPPAEGVAPSSPLPPAGPKGAAKPGAWGAPPAGGGPVQEDEADIAMREALAAARQAHPEDF